MKTSGQLKRAVLIGSTGLVGSHILDLILKDPRYSTIQTFARKSSQNPHPKHQEHLVNFDEISAWSSQIEGDVAFSALGTTKSAAGSIENQYKVDYTYQADFAKACAANGIKTFVLISSVGANANSRLPYLKMKGELEDFVKTLGFQSLMILNPGSLTGQRKERRLSEEISVPILNLISKVPFLSGLKPVEGAKVARQAVENGIQPGPVHQKVISD